MKGALEFFSFFYLFFLTFLKSDLGFFKTREEKREEKVRVL